MAVAQVRANADLPLALTLGGEHERRDDGGARTLVVLFGVL
jgi:hypothetical protein